MVLLNEGEVALYLDNLFYYQLMCHELHVDMKVEDPNAVF